MDTDSSSLRIFCLLLLFCVVCNFCNIILYLYLTALFLRIKYIYIGNRCVTIIWFLSKTFLFFQNETLFLLHNKSLILYFSSPSNHNSTFCLYQFNYSTELKKVKSYDIFCPLIYPWALGLFPPLTIVDNDALNIETCSCKASFLNFWFIGPYLLVPWGHWEHSIFRCVQVKTVHLFKVIYTGFLQQIRGLKRN